jgi:hypothetical protein
MIDKVVIYPTSSGIVIINPCDEKFTINNIALRSVPVGAPYLIVDASEIPEDRTFRDAWTADFSNPDGYGIGFEAWLATQPTTEVNNEN